MAEGGMEPPQGVIPNFNNPVKIVWTANMVAQALCISIVSTLYCVRVYVRIHIIRNFQVDDWLISVGFVSFLFDLLDATNLE